MLGQRERETTNEDFAFTAPGQDGGDAPPTTRPLDAPLVADPGFQQHFPDEVAALHGLDEPWLAAPAGVVIDASGYVTAVTSRTVTGARLAALLERYPRGVDAQTATVIAMDVLSALSALHERRVAHRGDLAEHAIITGDGTCVLVDVGLAPRPESEPPHDAIAADLRGFADLMARCLGESDGLGAGAEARSTHRSGDEPEPLHSIVARAATREAGPQTAAALLADVGVSANRQFDADWDVRTRERLAQIARSLADGQPAEDAAAPPMATRPRSVSLLTVVIAAVAVLGGATGFSLVILSRPHPTPNGAPSTIYQAVNTLPANTVPSAGPTGSASATATVTASTSPTASPAARPSSASPSVIATVTATTTPTTASGAASSPTAPRTPVSYEGDAGVNILAGGARAATCTGCPDGQKIRFIGNGGTLTFPDVTVPAAGQYTLVITYVDGDSGRDAIISVNGSAVLGVYFTGNGDWNSPQTRSVPVYLNSGQNSIEFSNANAWAPDIAEITV